MHYLIQQAEDLKQQIKLNEKEIDNPVLVLSVYSALIDLTEYLKEDKQLK
ncbi:hypothetical protein PQ478_08740 [Alkalihalophilus pseudofirmus]|nr:hypothetical protein [Alkalihalophilus pseudofirmus]WEG18556.1 hypothetical protein PQ478_08740 [Alkalihalophilus pseudofirmus]